MGRPERSSEDSVRAAALRLLALRPRSRHDLETALARRGFPVGMSAPVLDELTQRGYLDDVEYARSFARGRSGRLWGRRRMEEELAARGVDRQTIGQALGPKDQDAERAAAREAARRRTSHDPDPRRLAAYLRRRGFGSATIRAVLEERGEP